MDLLYGLHWDRDYLLDIVYIVKLIVPLFSLFTVYPASFYLLLVEGPAMIRAIRAAYLAYFAVHLYFDVVFNILMRVYALPPYGIFYCEGILCTVGLSKPIVMALMSFAIIMCIPSYVFLILRKMILFGASFSILIPPVVFLSAHAMRVLKQMAVFSTKTQRMTRRLFHVFRLQVGPSLC
ncbi:hypothetical protein PRIPAC_80393 [Pristionchus pacificus]|uniref:G protein-coupled receptor n=1 Tax=Pristionchus pacificus TaxID=54126 RepID=A0A2A6CNN8_PRIPA|nr:hypothetical protein PRIPAC_80393 [Pristionchus pacificus]|eukprot:PDM79697.1 G protein-coupled receptor [Pristionchus pacificus]